MLKVFAVRWAWSGRCPGNLALFNDEGRAHRFAEWIELTRFVAPRITEVSVGGKEYSEFAAQLMRDADEQQADTAFMDYAEKVAA